MTPRDASEDLACRARLAEGAAAADATRAAAERDDAKRRALAAMMGGTLERARADPLATLKRESWMSVPLKDMTPAQAKELREFERRVQEAEEAALKARRMAESERKAVEEKVLAEIRDFNARLVALHGHHLRARAARAAAEQQALALAQSLETVERADDTALAAAGESAALAERLKAAQALAQELRRVAEEQLREFAALAGAARALERGMHKALPRLEAHMPIVLSVYRCAAMPCARNACVRALCVSRSPQSLADIRECIGAAQSVSRTCAGTCSILRAASSTTDALATASHLASQTCLARLRPPSKASTLRVFRSSAKSLRRRTARPHAPLRTQTRRRRLGPW